MNFGKWVNERRKKLGLSGVVLGRISGVDSSSISRLERNVTKPTLMTSLKLFLALEASTKEIASLLNISEQAVERFASQNRDQSENILSTQEVVNFIRHFPVDEDNVTSWLADVLNSVVTQIAQMTEVIDIRGYKGVATYQPEEIYKFLVQPVIESHRIEYPEDITSEILYDWYEAGGALSLADAGMYIRKMREEKNIRQSDLKKAGFRSAGIISRMETGNIGLVKLEDVWELDNYLNADGDIFGIYWRAADLQISIISNESISRLSINEGQMFIDGYDLADFFITIWRWVETLPLASDYRRSFKEQFGH